jgi:starch phosphorylase
MTDDGTLRLPPQVAPTSRRDDPLQPMDESRELIAYFSMEMALDPRMPTYSGGLGILAGDFLRAAADQELDVVGVTLLHRKGYFSQRLDASGWQSEAPDDWDVAQHCRELPARVQVAVDGRAVRLRAWQYVVRGLTGRDVPVLLLDADLPENAAGDRALTHHLYGGDAYYRLCQEALLGIGGVRMLRALGYQDVHRFHMNEGHAALLSLELLDEHAQGRGRDAFDHADVEAVRARCVFTTHTPVPAGHDQFPLDLAARVLGRSDFATHQDVFCCDGVLNMTYLALNLSHYVNGVAKKHGEVSQHMFARYRVDAITNGVHAPTWACPSFAALFDRHIPGWRSDAFSLRYALGIAADEVWSAHLEAKTRLLEHVNRAARAGMRDDTLTLGFARRATAYKRPHLLLTDPERLKSVAREAGGLQVIFAGKAHPRDEEGKKLIQEIVRARDALLPEVRLVYLEGYDWELARLLVAGSDVWLNTPLPPLEASGTSGMKAALNGVPSLSVLDGWWIEGCIEGRTGWAVDGPAVGEGDTTASAAAALYDKLERVVAPLFRSDRDGFLDVMRHAIALNGAFFHAQRMVLQYVLKAYVE